VSFARRVDERSWIADKGRTMAGWEMAQSGERLNIQRSQL